MLSPKSFKAYDVRGIYPAELDEAGAYAIGRAYVDQFSPATIAVGRDMRLSSPSMAHAVREGAADGGTAVTASHNPKEYTGMKVVRQGALPVGGESGLLDVRDRALAAEWREAT